MAPRVLYITPFMNLGGTEKHILTLIRALRGQVEAYVAGPDGEACRGFSSHGIELLPLPSLKLEINLRSARKAINLLRKAIKDLRPDLIHVHAGIECAILARIAARPLGMDIPLVFTVHGYPGAKLPLDYLLAARLGNLIADRVIVVSESQRRLLLRLGLQRGKCIMIYNGILDPSRAGPSEIEPERDARSKGASGRDIDLRAKYEIGPDEIVVGSVARLEKVKGLDYLLRAYAEVARSRPSSRLVIVGWGSEEQRLQELARSLGLTGKVIFTGPIPDAARVMPSFDIFVLPSISEPFGIAAVEAMAWGLPVVASDVDGLREVVSGNLTGLVVKPKDESSLRDAILRLIDNPDERTRMGNAGRTKFREKFTAEVMAQNTFSVYRELFRHRQPDRRGATAHLVPPPE